MVESRHKYFQNTKTFGNTKVAQETGYFIVCLNKRFERFDRICGGERFFSDIQSIKKVPVCEINIIRLCRRPSTQRWTDVFFENLRTENHNVNFKTSYNKEKEESQTWAIIWEETNKG